MRTLRCLLLVSACMCCLSLSFAEDAYRNDFNDVTGWAPQPSWLSNASAQAKVVANAGIAEFSVPEPNRGMKWLLTLSEPVELDLAPWLVIRYRAVNCRPDADYLLWVKDGGKGDGVKLLAGSGQVKADGQWHTQAVSLADRGVAGPVYGIGLQCATTAHGNGTLYVDYIAMTDLPPTDAEGYAAPGPPSKVWPVDLSKPQVWTVQPSWVANHSEAAKVTASGAGLVFSVPEGSRGAKWSWDLAQPIEGARWVAMRYRGCNLQAFNDYTLYLASSGGGQAAQEQYVIRQTDLTADGNWHVAVEPVTVPSVRTLAVQVQAARNDATLEIADLRFLDAKPVIKLSDTFEATPGWPSDLQGWRSVSLPAGNIAGEDVARRLGMEGWIATGKVTACGVPFEIRGGGDAAIMTSFKPLGSVEVPLAGKSAEAYLLLASQFPTVDEPSYQGSGGLVRQVHRFIARIDYADGTSEEQFPWSLGSRQHALARGLQAYSLALQPGKTLQKLSLIDSMERGAFGLVALTLSDQPGPATAATRLQPALPLPPAKPVVKRVAGMTLAGKTLAVEAQSAGMTLDLSHGLRVAALTNRSGLGLGSQFAPGPLFRVLGDGFEVNSEQFAVDSVKQEAGAYRIDLSCSRVTPALRVTVWVDVAEPANIGLRARLDLGGHDAAKTRFIFPEIRDLRFGSIDDLWVWTPRRGDVITSETVSIREPYAGAGNPLQIIGAFDPRQGTGCYVMTEDMDAVSRFYLLEKSAKGARLAVEYTPVREETPRTVIGFNQGDWHAQLQRYRDWAATWYKPAAPRKSWFREVFSFRQQFLHYGTPLPSGMFDKQTKTFHIKEVLDADEQAFGGLDYLHLFDWGWDPVHGRCGDYLPWDYLGGVDNFQKAIAEVQAAGTPVGLYIEGILVDPQSTLGKAHGAQWQLLDAQGKPYPYYAPSFDMCPWVKPWQDYLSDTYQRVQGQTSARGYYIDEYGFSDDHHWCYNPAHGHPVPVTPVLGERQMLQKVRQKLGPQAALYTEESPTDVNSQFQDGSFTYNISSVPDGLSPTHVNLYRFAYPDFKTIEIITCDHSLGSNVEAVKRILFNGEAIWIEGNPDRWFTKAVRQQIALNHRVMRDNRQCFTGQYVAALVPTLVSGVYANRFSERPDLVGKTCWTVYNTNYRTVSAEVLAVDHAPGAQYLDEMTGKPLPVRVVGKKAYLTLTLAPRDVVVISRGLYMK